MATTGPSLRKPRARLPHSANVRRRTFAPLGLLLLQKTDLNRFAFALLPLSVTVDTFDEKASPNRPKMIDVERQKYLTPNRRRCSTRWCRTTGRCLPRRRWSSSVWPSPPALRRPSGPSALRRRCYSSRNREHLAHPRRDPLPRAPSRGLGESMLERRRRRAGSRGVKCSRMAVTVASTPETAPHQYSVGAASGPTTAARNLSPSPITPSVSVRRAQVGATRSMRRHRHRRTQGEDESRDPDRRLAGSEHFAERSRMRSGRSGRRRGR